MQPAKPISPVPGYLWWNVVAGAIFGLAAVLTAWFAGFEISGDLGADRGQITWLALFSGVFLMGCLGWWLLVSWPGRFSPWRGMVAGILTAVFSYPAVVWLADTFQRDPVDLFNVLDRLGTVLLITTLTLMTTGFLFIPVLALVGLAIGWLLVIGHPAAAPTRSALALRIQWLAGGVALALALFLTLGYAWLTLTPVDTRGLALAADRSSAASNHEQAMALFATVQTEESGMPLHPLCPSTVHSHGTRTARSVVIFHGLTSCPAQGRVLAERLFALGYNVYMPRMVGHGESDPLTLSLLDLKAEDLVRMADLSVDIAAGLGEEVTVVGLSAGGTVSSWVAQYRTDVAQAVPVSPFFGPFVVPHWATTATINLALMLPNIMLPWNPLEVEPGPDSYAFPTPSTHTLAQVMRMGALVHGDAGKAAPAVKQIGVLLNGADIAVNNVLARQLIEAWQVHGATVRLEELPFSYHLPHDLIDPRERTGNIDLVYAMVLDLMGPTPAP